MKTPLSNGLDQTVTNFSYGKIGFLLGGLLISQWLLTDFIHFPGGSFGLFVLVGGTWWLFKPSKKTFDSPVSTEGWVNRCKQVFEQIGSFEGEQQSEEEKKKKLALLQSAIERPELQTLACVCSVGAKLPSAEMLKLALDGSTSVNLSWPMPLPLNDESWAWPDSLYEKDLLLFFVSLPLRAADLLWLEKVPEDQQTWLMVPSDDSADWSKQLEALKAQLPARWNKQILRVNNSETEFQIALSPVLKALQKSRQNIDLTRQRLLARLHTSLQSDLEKLRRKKFRVVQQRSQWVVAGAVFASPVTSTDLLALAVVNGLMVKEMAKIWNCSWKADLMQSAAKQLATVAVTQGVVEWSGQALLAVAKLHGSSWFAAGTLQALSSAYLTRVVGRSMADWMALNNGVAQPDLAALKLQSSELVAKAAREERVDWSGFIKQAGIWINEQNLQHGKYSDSLETT